MAATIKDIARETGLSLATISKYLNGGNLREKNRAAIEAAIKKLDYHVNEYARGLKSKKSRTVGVVTVERCVFNMKIVAVFERVLQENGYSVIVTDCQNNLEQEASSVDFLLKKQVDGIINVPIGSSSRHLRPAVEKKVPILLLDRPLEDLKRRGQLRAHRQPGRPPGWGCAACSRRATGALGCWWARMRCTLPKCALRGYRDALEEYGVEYDESLVRRCDLTLEGGYRQARRLLKANTGMTAMFLTNYDLTLGALIALNERGVQIPGEMSVVGFDNIMDLSRVFRPSLTIVSQPLEQIGLQAARLMLDQLSGGKDATPMTITLAASLKEGGSVEAPPAQP